MAKITAGSQRGRCTGPQDVKFGESSNGNLQIGLIFEITAGDCKGQRAPWYCTVEGSAEGKAIAEKALFACGWDGKSWTELQGITRNCVRLGFVEEDGRVRLKYVDPDAAVKFNRELSEDEARARFARLGMSGRSNGGPAQTESEPSYPLEDPAF